MINYTKSTFNDIVEDDIDKIVNNILPFCGVLEGKRILITGGMGFLGTYFCKTLQKLNDTLRKPVKIIILDNHITSKSKFKKSKYIQSIKKDISSKFSITGKLDFIIHAASIASPPIYRKFPIETLDVNYQGTRNLLEIAKKKKVKSFLYLSSSEIYGDPDQIPTPETYVGKVSNLGPRACYDESKRLGETICILYHQQFNVPVKIARPFNVYGPHLNLNDGRVIPDFMNNAIKNSKIIIHSDGSPTRSFCYVSDAIRAFFRILLLAPPASIFNVGNDEEVSILELTNKMKECINKSLQIKFIKSTDPNYTIDNPQRRCPDLSRIKKVVDYRPTIKLKEGLERTYNWYLGDMQ